jgi:hypothetical protein
MCLFHVPFEIYGTTGTSGTGGTSGTMWNGWNKSLHYLTTEFIEAYRFIILRRQRSQRCIDEIKKEKS